MLYESGMAPSFWGEALATFVHVHNRISTSALPDTTPHESFLGNKPDVSMLRVWGCTAYVLVQKDKRPLGSLGSHMERCIFIGYPYGYKAWKFYCPESKKVIISERADFDERFSSIRGILHPRFHHPFLTSYHHHLLWCSTQVRRVNKGSTRRPFPPLLPWEPSPSLPRPAFVHPLSPRLCLGNIDPLVAGFATPPHSTPHPQTPPQGAVPHPTSPSLCAPPLPSSSPGQRRQPRW